MTKMSPPRIRARVFGAFCAASALSLASAPAVQAQEGGITAQTLIDRAEIEDLLTRYYYNFGTEDRESFSDFYAEDAKLILGDTVYEGREGILAAYGGSGENSPTRNAYSFNVTISNPLIVVHGDTATSQLTFTEYLMENRGDAPRVLTQGREYATFVKVDGLWRYQTRQIKGGTEPPEGWEE